MRQAAASAPRDGIAQANRGEVFEQHEAFEVVRRPEPPTSGICNRAGTLALLASASTCGSGWTMRLAEVHRLRPEISPDSTGDGRRPSG